MLTLEQIAELAQVTPDKIVLFVIDGLGGLPHPQTGKAELETAKMPHLDALAFESSLGLIDPVLPGITPGSGPGHLAIFGYDPVKYLIKRGIIEALGIDLPVESGDILARGNFCTIEGSGVITDRRAGRLPTEENARLCQKLNELHLVEAEASFYPVQDYRLVLRLRGEGLSDDLTESDPGRVGDFPLEVKPLSPRASRTAEMVNHLLQEAQEALRGQDPANMILLRGFSQLPHVPLLSQLFKVDPAALAIYPMYRGLARALGMKVLPCGASFAEEVEALAQHWNEHDFFYLHFKGTDSAGEDGDFDRKVRALEEVDASLAMLLELNPDVLVITGDHSSPSLLKGHSWHPVPLLIRSRYCFPDHLRFTERDCARGSLGRFPATQILPLAMAHALKLAKFGA